MTAPSDWFNQARKAVKEEATQTPQFKFEDEGTIVQGVFIKAQPTNTKNGVGYMVFVKPIEMPDITEDDTDENGYVMFWAPTTLQRQLFDVCPKPGGLILVEYVESRQSEQNPGRSYKVFGVQASESDSDYWVKVAESAKAKKTISQVTGSNASTVAESAFDEAPF